MKILNYHYLYFITILNHLNFILYFMESFLLINKIYIFKYYKFIKLK